MKRPSPNTADIGLDMARGRARSRNIIRVSERLQTTAPGAGGVGERCQRSPAFVTKRNASIMRARRNHVAVESVREVAKTPRRRRHRARQNWSRGLSADGACSSDEKLELRGDLDACVARFDLPSIISS
jgi:hypothetical protein